MTFLSIGNFLRFILGLFGFYMSSRSFLMRYDENFMKIIRFDKPLDLICTVKSLFYRLLKHLINYISKTILFNKLSTKDYTI